MPIPSSATTKKWASRKWAAWTRRSQLRVTWSWTIYTRWQWSRATRRSERERRHRRSLWP